MAEPIFWSEQGAAPVCICGIGGRTPVGLSAASSAAAVRGAMSAIAAHPLFLDKAGEPVNMARDTAFDLELPIADRMEQLLGSAIAEAIAALAPGDVPVRGSRLACHIGLSEPRPGLPSNIGPAIGAAMCTAFGWPAPAIRVLQHGHVSGLMALQLAAQRIAAGELDMCVAAGVESYHDPATLAWLDHHGALMSARNRSGFPPSEGAGACLIASRSFAERNALPVLARIRAAAIVREPHLPGGPGVCVGEGLTAAVRAVSTSLRLPEQAITATYCDLNGQRYRNEEFVYALLRTQESFVDAHDYECPADCWGDVGAASGPLFASLAIRANERGYSKGRFPLAWAGSNAGYRSAMVLELTPH